MRNRTRILPVSSDHETNRLINQAACWEPESDALFDQIGIWRGWRCVDLGCGPMGILGLLSKRVGSHGQVVGVDSNLDYIHTANEFIQRNHLFNVKMVEGDLYGTTLNPGFFNLTHERFIFSQIGCDQQLLEMMITLTRPGGIIVSQESDWTTWNCYPKNPFWDKLRNALIALFEMNGGDINAGQRTYKMLTTAALADVHIRTIIKALPIGHPYRAGMNHMAISLRDRIIEANILTNNEFDEALDECNRDIYNPATIIFSYTLCQVWGTVKK